MPRLRLALVVNRFWPEVGGAETNLYFQARELARQFDVTVFAPRRQSEEPAEEFHAGFRIRRLRDWRNIRGRFPNLAAKTWVPALFLHLLRGRFDLVQVFPSLNTNSLIAFLATRLMRIPFIFCSFDFIDYAALIRAGGGSIDVDTLDHYRPSWRERLVLRRAEQIFAIAYREMRMFARFNPQVAYSPVPILLDEYAQPVPSPRARYRIDSREFVFLCLGRISAIKGQDLAVAAFTRIAEAAPHARLVIVGRDDYEREFTAAMRQRVHDNALGERVTFTGMVERSEVIAWLSHADAHVIPVRFMNSGAVVAESWAAGTIVIQSDAVDPNYVREGENGYLFASGDVGELADKMLSAYRDSDALPAMAEAGRRFVLEKLTYPSLIGLYVDAYRRLLPRSLANA